MMAGAGLMKSLCLTAARFAICAWVGAAALFVVTSIREVTAAQIDSATRDLLVPVRFAGYYAFGFALMGVALACGWLARRHAQVSGWRVYVSLLLLAAALGLMIADYVLIYRPLVEMITPPGQARSATFVAYHRWSEQVNGVGFGLCAAAALLLLWPRANSPESAE